MIKKIISIEKLKKIIFKQKAKKKVVLCHGVFDLLHVGHIYHFEEAKEHGDLVIVSVTPDKYVNKAPNRPFFNFTNRAKVISSLSLVDYVIKSDNETSVEIIKFLKFLFDCNSRKLGVFGEDMLTVI